MRRGRSVLAIMIVSALPGQTWARPAPAPPEPMYPALAKYIEEILPGRTALSEDRKLELRKIAHYVKRKIEAREPANLLFICTHNSRRSHIAQLWAATAAAYYRVKGVGTFSGGTEATAFNPRAVAAMQRAGFQIESAQGTNPHHMVSHASGSQPLEVFSKTFTDKVNPQTNFAAVMTCAQADKSCPMVAGASLRVALHYEDPKLADGKPEEAATYDARTRQIATEMLYLFSEVAK